MDHERPARHDAQARRAASRLRSSSGTGARGDVVQFDDLASPASGHVDTDESILPVGRDAVPGARPRSAITATSTVEVITEDNGLLARRPAADDRRAPVRARRAHAPGLRPGGDRCRRGRQFLEGGAGRPRRRARARDRRLSATMLRRLRAAARRHARARRARARRRAPAPRPLPRRDRRARPVVRRDARPVAPAGGRPAGVRRHRVARAAHAADLARRHARAARRRPGERADRRRGRPPAGRPVRASSRSTRRLGAPGDRPASTSAASMQQSSCAASLRVEIAEPGPGGRGRVRTRRARGPGRLPGGSTVWDRTSCLGSCGDPGSVARIVRILLDNAPCASPCRRSSRYGHDAPRLRQRRLPARVRRRQTRACSSTSGS